MGMFAMVQSVINGSVGSDGTIVRFEDCDSGTRVHVEFLRPGESRFAAVKTPLALPEMERQLIRTRCEGGSPCSVAKMFRRLAKGKLPSGCFTLADHRNRVRQKLGVVGGLAVGRDDDDATGDLQAERFQ